MAFGGWNNSSSLGSNGKGKNQLRNSMGKVGNQSSTMSESSAYFINCRYKKGSVTTKKRNDNDGGWWASKKRSSGDRRQRTESRDLRVAARRPVAVGRSLSIQRLQLVLIYRRLYWWQAVLTRVQIIQIIHLRIPWFVCRLWSTSLIQSAIIVPIVYAHFVLGLLNSFYEGKTLWVLNWTVCEAHTTVKT